MEIGIDSFAAANLSDNKSIAINNTESLEQLLERIEYADKVGLNVFGIGNIS